MEKPIYEVDYVVVDENDLESMNDVLYNALIAGSMGCRNVHTLDMGTGVTIYLFSKVPLSNEEELQDLDFSEFTYDAVKTVELPSMILKKM